MKLTALFIASFLIVFIALFFFDLFHTMGEGLRVDSAVSNQPAVSTIDPKIESDLVKVLEYTDVQTTADVKNPFSDPGGISDKFNAPVNANTTATTTGVNQTADQNNPQNNQTQQNLAARTAQTTIVPPNPEMETKIRLQLRDEKIRLGQDAGPESAVFAIEDLIPVGTVAGGDGKDEVMFYSQAGCRVFSFPVGTQFFDGWLDSLRPEGVVFGYNDQYRTMRLKAFGRSVKTGCPENLSVLSSSDQAVKTGGN